jgi:hypothetical protein
VNLDTFPYFREVGRHLLARLGGRSWLASATPVCHTEYIREWIY